MRFSIIISLIIVFNAIVAPAQSWSIFRGNQQLSGVTSANLPEKPKLLASFQTGDDIKASPVFDGQTIFCGSTDGTMYAIGFDGKLKWKFASGNSIEAPALALNGSVLFGQLDGLFFRLDEKTGKQIWKYKTDNQIMGSANWLKVGGQIRLFVGSYDYNLHCFGFTKGDSIWRYESDNYINGAPALYDKYAVFGGCDGFLHLVNIETGKVFKKIKLETYVASSPVIDGKYAYVGDYEGRFFCIDLDAGKIAWTYDDKEKNLPFIASPALSGNLIVIGNQDKYIYCFDKSSGKIVWKAKAGNRVESSSVIASGKVITGSMDGMLYIHDLKTGKELWKYELGSPIIGSPAVVSGKIVVGAGDGRIYIFG
jgi:outer membrane protein assembly factor BamB